MFDKITFRDQVRDYLIQEIIAGKLKKKQKLSLADLSRKLDVSVTPIREAFSQLEQSGIISYKLNQGFFIKDHDLEEARDIYQTIGFMEGMAIEASVFTKKDIKELYLYKNKFKTASSVLQRLKTDYQFHQELIKNYSNTPIKNIIENLKASVYLIELDYMESDFTYASNITHHSIIEKLEKKDLKAAGEEIREHWRLSYEFLKKLNNEK